MLESICGWEKLDNRRGFHSDRQRLISAISRRVATWLTNDWTEVTLPDAEPDDRSRPGPTRTFSSPVEF